MHQPVQKVMYFGHINSMEAQLPKAFKTTEAECFQKLITKSDLSSSIHLHRHRDTEQLWFKLNGDHPTAQLH